MYNVSAEFKTAIKDSPRQILSYLTIGGVTYDKEIQGIKPSLQSTDGDIIGQAVCQSFDAEMLLTKEQYAALDTSDEVVLYFGIVLSGLTEYVPQNKFLIKSYSYDNDKGRFKMSCADYMAEFDKHQVKDLPTLTYPLTADDYLHAVCVKAGVIKSAETYWGNDTILTQAPNFNGTESLREALKGLAQMCLANCYMNKSGELKMSCIIDSTAQSITAGEYFTATFGEKIIPINTISLVRDPANDIIYAKDQAMIDVDGVSDLGISNNPFMDYDRVTFANLLLNKVKGLSFYPCEIDWRGNFALDAFEKLSVTAVDNTVKSTYLYNRETTYNGGLREKISCKGYNKKAVAYAKGKTVQEKLRNTEISVDKVNQRIDAFVVGSYTKEQVDTVVDSAIGVSEGNVKIYVDEKTALNSHTYTTAPDKYQKNDVFVLDKEYITTQTHDFQVGQMLIAKENQDTSTAQHVVCKNGDVIRFKDGTYLFLANLDFSKWDKKDKYQTDNDVSAKIQVTANEINSEVTKKVNNTEIISTINQSAEQVSINANKINLNGAVTANENFKILLDGSMQAKSGTFAGEIRAGNDNEISCKIGEYNVGVSPDNTQGRGLGFFKGTEYIGGILAERYLEFSQEWTQGMIFHSNNNIISMESNNGDIYIGNVDMGMMFKSTWILVGNENILSSEVQSAYFQDMYAKSYGVNSDREKKTNIYQENIYALNRLKDIKAYSYKLGDTTQKLGLMYDEAPPEIQRETEKGDKYIDLYAFNSLNAKAIQELSKKFERFSNYVDDLVLENQQLRKDIERQKKVNDIRIGNVKTEANNNTKEIAEIKNKIEKIKNSEKE